MKMQHIVSIYKSIMRFKEEKEEKKYTKTKTVTKMKRKKREEKRKCERNMHNRMVPMKE